ncbi:MAG TPA: prolipoprotein diacylglyceryl transferase [Anaerolineae bacterium]|nr:prolipoprotein diacylglyceryl transferase [Anaerolineae bacterium]
MPCDLGLHPGFCIGPLPVRFYGIIIVTAALIGGFVATREARRLGENTDRIWDALIFVVIAGIIGARLYHVLSTPAGCNENVPLCGWPWYRNHPLDAIVGILQGGLGIFGAIVGGLIVVLIFVRHYKLSLARYLDIAAPALLIAQAIGRWGNFVNQELYGPPTTLPWGIPIDEPYRYGDFTDLTRYPLATTRFHPLFLYESLINVIGFIVLVLLARKWQRKKEGDLILIYMIWYGMNRMIVESLRPDAWTLVNGLPTAQLISIVLVVVGAVVLIVRHVRKTETSVVA